uniref:Uncharacterized protein n=1 Tax=Fagus sylvatica TaxID=28930 RepID=A0A2N9IPH3_FAGSY
MVSKRGREPRRGPRQATGVGSVEYEERRWWSTRSRESHRKVEYEELRESPQVSVEHEGPRWSPARPDGHRRRLESRFGERRSRDGHLVSRDKWSPVPERPGGAGIQERTKKP